MKKLVLSLAVLGTFLLYSLGIRDKSPVLSKPAALATNTTPSVASNPAPIAASVGTKTSTTSSTNTTTGQYKDGTYKGSVEDAFYGNVQISAKISDGKISDVTFLDYPHTHDTSVIINQQAMPFLKQEAIKAQNSNVDIITGATFTSLAFTKSLTTALSQARV